MKPLWLLLAFNLSAADLSKTILVISPRAGVVLGNRSTRPDFVSFRIEFLPSTPPTNLVTITITNELLRTEDMAQVPSGPGIMGVQAIYASEESDVALHRYDLRRGRPPAPSVRPTAIGITNDVERRLTNELKKIREGRAPAMPPPLPPGVYSDGPVKAQAVVPFLRPLPNATNRSYADHLDWIADRAMKGKRRNE